MDKPTRTVIKVNKNYEVIKKEVENKKEIPKKILDIIVPILKEVI